MAKLRTAITGAPGLLAKEVAGALEERRFPTLEPRLLRSPLLPANQNERGWTEFADEAVVLEPFASEELDDLNVLFLAGTPQEARAAWERVQSLPELITVDLTGALADEPEAEIGGLEPASEAADGARTDRQRLLAVAHPAAQALALLLGRLGVAGRLEAVVTVFEPASQRGMDGIQALEQQTRSALAMQPWPRAVFDAQIAFNLQSQLGPEASPSLQELRQWIAGQTDRLLGRSEEAAGDLRFALNVLQAPTFHASLISLYARVTPAARQDALDSLLTSTWIARTETQPDALAAAGRDEIMLGPLLADPAGGVWLYAALDNLRRSAFGAVDAAAAAARGMA